jgi:hypothetical protein
LALSDLIVARLLPAGAALTIAVDDTLFTRSGKKVFGVAWHHDGAAKGPKPIGFGHCWVVAGIVVQLPKPDTQLRGQQPARPVGHPESLRRRGQRRHHHLRLVNPPRPTDRLRSCSETSPPST